MDNLSREMLRRVDQNDTTLTELWIGIEDFISNNAMDWSRLGDCIGENNHLTELHIDIEGILLNRANTQFFRGLVQNSSINWVDIKCDNQILVGGVIHEILNAYQENNSFISRISLKDAGLQHGGHNVIATTLRRCTNLKSISLINCGITAEQLLPIVEALKVHDDLQQLYLSDNVIGNAGCDTVATLLEGPSTLQRLALSGNHIDLDADAARTITNSLANNTQLKDLFFATNGELHASAEDIFSGLLCNTSSIGDTYSSNHTLETLFLPEKPQSQFASLRAMNLGTNKRHVAIKKILRYHPIMDMKPLFDWDMGGERSLKALPFVIAWFERAAEAVADEDIRYDPFDLADAAMNEVPSYHVEEKKLAAILDFARAMPLMFVPTSHQRG